MEEESPPRKRLDVEEEDANFPYYVLPRIVDAPKVDLPKKVNTNLVSPQILDNVPLLMDKMPKLSKMKFKYFDTQMQNGLKRADCMVPNHPSLSGAQVLRLMEFPV